MDAAPPSDAAVGIGVVEVRDGLGLSGSPDLTRLGRAGAPGRRRRLIELEVGLGIEAEVGLRLSAGMGERWQSKRAVPSLASVKRLAISKVLTKILVNGYPRVMRDVHVIDDPAAATVALEPVRSRLLAELAAPASAATLARRVGLARQKVNYHLHALEAHGLVHLAEERTWGGITERLLVATAASYVVSPRALGPVAVDPNREVDRLSASYLIALGARLVREAGDLVRRAQETRKRLATLAVDTEVRFQSATDRAAFSAELTEAITRLVSKYHDASVPGGRAHRLVVLAHPLPHESNSREPS